MSTASISGVVLGHDRVAIDGGLLLYLLLGLLLGKDGRGKNGGGDQCECVCTHRRSYRHASFAMHAYSLIMPSMSASNRSRCWVYASPVAGPEKPE
jgi:hypothetical protein